MNKLKKAVIAVLLISCCVSLTGCKMGEAILFGMLISNGNDSVPKDEICEYVSKHITQLSSFPYELYRETAEDEATEKRFIQNALGKDTIVKNVYRYGDGIIEFYCGGTGIVTSSTYCGFYFSENDVPNALEFSNSAQFEQTSEGVYEWRSEDRQKAFYTERIQTNWFYYYMEWH